MSDLAHHNEILTMDKAFLGKEMESAAQRAESAQREVDRLQEKVRDLKRRKEELTQALADTKEQAKVAYDERLNTVSPDRMVGEEALTVFPR